jgi:hypothetical protein
MLSRVAGMPQVALGADVVLNQQPFDFLHVAER